MKNKYYVYFENGHPHLIRYSEKTELPPGGEIFDDIEKALEWLEENDNSEII